MCQGGSWLIVACLALCASRGSAADLDRLGAVFEADGLDAQVFEMGTRSFVVWLDASDGSEPDGLRLCARVRRVFESADLEHGGVVLLSMTQGTTRCEVGTRTKALDELLRLVREADLHEPSLGAPSPARPMHSSSAWRFRPGYGSPALGRRPDAACATEGEAALAGGCGPRARGLCPARARCTLTRTCEPRASSCSSWQRLSPRGS